MNYADIVYFDTGNSHGISTTLFVSGCDMRCKNCHNPQAQDFSYGKPFTKKEEDEIIESLKNPHVRYFVLSGGQPSSDENKETCIKLIRRIKKEAPGVEIILYTGHKVSEIDCRFLLHCDYIIDGEYKEEYAVEGLDLRGSYNQSCWEKLSVDRVSSEVNPIKLNFVLINRYDYFKSRGNGENKELVLYLTNLELNE